MAYSPKTVFNVPGMWQETSNLKRRVDMAEEQNPRIIFIESDEDEETIRRQMPNEQLRKVDVWVRTPDSETLDELQVAARLCSCRRVCLAVIEDQL
jgi:hypothetical protein